MENSGYIALARQVALDRALDITANNVANMRTTGYKAEKVLFEQYLQKPFQVSAKPDPLSSVVQLGVFTDQSAGGFEQTGNPLDFAIQGDGFFSVQTDGGTRYTRAGSFRLDDSGQVVTQDGHPVLDASGTPLQLPTEGGNIVVSGDGQVAVNGAVVGQIGVVRFADPQALVREGSGLYSSNAPSEPATGNLVQGMIEGSNVQPVLEITRMMEVLRSFQAAQQMVESQHDLGMKSVDKIGKV
jgi:flagellar basal-body rod protein FlgF